ncbi:MAG: type IX secretion system outer membrane channel protein PorV [Porphyromonas sp.]|nr:type IX secretion system outer membrane channel protein PorV [Porphyromonas sp.]
MMDRRKIYTVALVLLGLCGSVQAQEDAKQYNPVVTGAPILSIAPDAVSSAMGEIGLTTGADAHSIYHNISKLAFIDEEWGISFGYTPWMSEVVKDISLSTLSGYFRWGNTGAINHAVSMSARYFHIGEAQAFAPGSWTPVTIVPYELAVDAGYSMAINEHWGVGVSLRYLRSDYNYTVDDVKGCVDKFLADFSATYRTNIKLTGDYAGLLTAAVAVNNIGGKMSYDGGKNYLFSPAILRLGVGLELENGGPHRAGLHLEANKMLAPTYNESDRKNPEPYNNMSMWSAIANSFGDASGGAAEEFKEVTWAVGAEYAYEERFFLRGGYRYQDPSKGTNSGVSMGAGFVYNRAKVDLSYFLASQSRSPLNNTFRLTLGVNF